MLKEYMNEIEKAAADLKKRLLEDAHADFVTLYSNTAITSEQARLMAKKYVNMYLSQELYLKLQTQLAKEINL